MTGNAILDSTCLVHLIGKVDAQQMNKLVGLFMATARNDLAACRQHLTAGDAGKLEFAMHKLKSSARTVGAMHFAETAEFAELASRETRLDEAAHLFAELEKALAAVEKACSGQGANAAAIAAGGKDKIRASSRLSGDLVGFTQRNAPATLSQDVILEGIRSNEFEIHFQPKADAVTLRVVGVEALARWRHRGRYVSPAAFIAAAVQHDLIEMLSETLLSSALVGSACLAEEGFPLPVSINLSVMWLARIHLPELITACVVGTGFKPEDVTLEITEASLTDDMEIGLNALARLRRKGFKLSIDDFGAGSLSLQQIERLDVDEVKIDGRVIHRGSLSPATRRALAATIDLARELRLGSVAQGVESLEHLDLARGVGCDLVQGWYIAPPMPGADLFAWLRERQS